MASRTRVLHVEDEATDSDLVNLWLHEAGLDWDVVRVETRDAFVTALESEPFDLVLSDFQLPSFNGHEALRETRRRRPELAFVFFTATLGEERAVEALKAGATDFVAKERPDRLVPALLRAVGNPRNVPPAGAPSRTWRRGRRASGFSSRATPIRCGCSTSRPCASWK